MQSTPLRRDGLVEVRQHWEWNIQLTPESLGDERTVDGDSKDLASKMTPASPVVTKMAELCGAGRTEREWEKEEYDWALAEKRSNIHEVASFGWKAEGKGRVT